MNLDLDEFTPVEEGECEEECPLCLHDNTFLSMQHRILTPKCSKKHYHRIPVKCSFFSVYGRCKTAI